MRKASTTSVRGSRTSSGRMIAVFGPPPTSLKVGRWIEGPACGSRRAYTPWIRKATPALHLHIDRREEGLAVDAPRMLITKVRMAVSPVM
jgi:hypothetical protein